MPDSESVKNIDVPNSPLWKLIHLRRLDSNGSGLFYWRPTRFFTAFQCCCILLVLVLPIQALRLNLPPPVYAQSIPEPWLALTDYQKLAPVFAAYRDWLVRFARTFGFRTVDFSVKAQF